MVILPTINYFMRNFFLYQITRIIDDVLYHCVKNNS